MSRSELFDVIGLVTAEPPQAGDGPAVAGWLQRLCRAAKRDLPALGVGVSLFPRAGEPLPAAASSELVATLEELQFTLGEGPCIAAYDGWRPVLVPDLSAWATSTWLAYAPAAQERGVEAVFSFPIQQGAARMGALDVYRDRVGSLSPAALKRALTYAEAVMGSLLIADQSEELSPDSLFADSDATFEVYQAQGMVMAQLRVPADVAMARLRAYAFAEERPLGTVAADVLARRIVFTDHDGEH